MMQASGTVGPMIQVLVGARATALDGDVSGDAFGTFRSKRGPLVALADGLGHGPRAAEASAAFLRSIEENADESFEAMFMRAHHALVRTRGVVAAAVRFDESRREVEIGGLGNITALVVRGGTRATPLGLLPGVLGSAYRKVRPHVLPFAVNDVVVLHTDGVRPRFDLAPVRTLSPQAAVDEILRVAGKSSDDAAVVVARAILPTELPSPPRQAAVDAPAVPVDRLPLEVIRIAVAGDEAACALAAREYAKKASLSPRAQWEVSIAASELATNVLKFAGTGTLALSFDGEELTLDVHDEGRGIDHVTAAVVDGWSEGAALTPDRPRHPGQGLGVGLGTVHRMMDRVAIETAPGRGTRVVAHKRRMRS